MKARTERFPQPRNPFDDQSILHGRRDDQPLQNVSIDLAYGYITSADPERTGSCDYYNSLTYKAVYAQTYGQLIAGGMAPEQAKIQAHTTANDKAIQPFSGNYSLSAHTFAIGVNLKF